MKTRWLLAAAALVAASAAAGAQQISNGLVTVRAVKDGKAYAGFDLIGKGKTVATVRLSGGGLLAAQACEADPRAGTLRFTGLTPREGAGLELSGGSVTVTAAPNDPYPLVAFDLSIGLFDAAKWQSVAGKQPFHFLALYMPDAEVWHHRGWLNATPLVDPFPLLQDTHVGTPEISAWHYNRNWSYTPPLSGHPLPVIGLWAPAGRRYAAFDFQGARLGDNSEKDIATGYHWEQGETTVGARAGGGRTPKLAKQYVALVYPYGGIGYQMLEFPKAGTRVASSCRLIWSTELGPTDDPNILLYADLWRRQPDRLPTVPAVVDMSWLPGGVRLPDFEGPPVGGLISGQEGQFQVPGTQLIAGWRWQNENPVMTAKLRGDQARIDYLRGQAEELLKYAKRFKAGGDDCVYWEKPLTGEWTPQWGGKPVTTLHNANGFAAGRLFLGLYRDAGMKQYLPVVDGVMSWAKHVVWTRNEFADVPSSPFAIGGTLSASFCLDYYAAFRDAPDERHRNEARRALELARAFTYRYMVMWPSDSDRSDSLQPAFLWEPNSGRDWTAAACSNEVFWNLDTLAQTAVHTGDPILMWALQGSLSRWHLLYQERYKSSLAAYQPADMAEGYGLAPGNVYGLGARAAYGFASPLDMIEPVGASSVRVLAGERAAMAFDKNGADTTIAEYRYTAPGNLSFTLRGRRPAFDLSLTVPYVDMSAKPVAIVRDGRTIELKAGEGFRRPPQAPWSLYVSALQAGDRVIVGEPDENGPVLPSSPPRVTPPAPAGSPDPAFRPIALAYDAQVKRDWSDLTSWAGLPEGVLWAYGVPLWLAPQSGAAAVSKPVTFAEPVQAEAVYIAYSPGEGPAPSLVLADGKRISSTDVPVTPQPAGRNRRGRGAAAVPIATAEAMAWRAWPPIFSQKLLVMGLRPARTDQIAGVDPGGRLVFAVTALAAGRAATAGRIRTDLAAGGAEWKSVQQQERMVSALRSEAANVPVGAIAVLPPSPASAVINLMEQSGVSEKATALGVEQLVQEGALDPKRTPVAVYAGGEMYVHTVSKPGDAAEAVVRYVQQGGTLALVSGQPYPMFYATGGGAQRPDPLLSRVGFALADTIELDLPPGPLKVETHASPDFDVKLPAAFPYPPGDPRLRSVDKSRLPAGSTYTPLLTVTGADGKGYGDAGCILTLAGGGRILYLWDGLIRDPVYGPAISAAATRFIIRAAQRTGP